MAYDVEKTKNRIGEIKKNIEIKKGELSNLEKNKQELLNAETSIREADLDKNVQKTVMEAINNALEANA